ncbi:MAG: glycosyl hydrolase [Marinilabiliales bacterium]|nr:MAG: glycosyl hydrolase [Marinilabiliales bacterium]
MKLFFKILKIFGFSLLALVILVSGIVLTGLWYRKHDLRFDRQAFPQVQSEADIDILAGELLEQMSLDEKLWQLSGESPFITYRRFLGSWFLKDQFPHIFSGRNRRLNIPPFVLSDGPRGAVVGTGNTSFPVAMARGASFDTDMERRVGDVMGMELRANNTNYLAAPCINLLRHPAWGRAQETYGEDPWLLGEMGLALVSGAQRHNVMACAKHFAVNSIENSRFYVDVHMDERTLREVYLPHFKKVVQEGNIASIMSAYNRFRGEYCGHSEYLLTEILREEWGFEGFVSSDWVFGLRDGVMGINAGMDVEMPARTFYSPGRIKPALEKGEVTMEQIDAMVLRVLRTKLLYAFRDDIMTYDESLKASDRNISLAREVAGRSMVLVKNEGVLPFDIRDIRTVAVIGALADVENTGDRGSSHVRTPYIVTPWQGISSYAEANGVRAVLYDGHDAEEARQVASEADAVIVVAGYTHEDEGEFMGSTDGPPPDHTGSSEGRFTAGGDRPDLRLKQQDRALIAALAGVNPATVVTYVGGSAIMMEEWRNDIPAILFAWYAGMEGGNALAEVLFGDVNPAARLPFTIPVNENDLPFFDRWVDSITYGYYHGYTLFDKKGYEAAYPFGHGLSYTTFSYGNLEVLTPAITCDESLEVSVEVTNTGIRTGDEVVQLYIGFGNSAADRPVKLLRGFRRIELLPGETRRVEFELPASELAMYDPVAREWVIEQMVYEIYAGPSSSKDDLLVSEFEVL